jgi:hypothetical protein
MFKTGKTNINKEMNKNSPNVILKKYFIVRGID